MRFSGQELSNDGLISTEEPPQENLYLVVTQSYGISYFELVIGRSTVGMVCYSTLGGIRNPCREANVPAL